MLHLDTGYGELRDLLPRRASPLSSRMLVQSLPGSLTDHNTAPNLKEGRILAGAWGVSKHLRTGVPGRGRSRANLSPQCLTRSTWANTKPTCGSGSEAPRTAPED